MKHARDKHKRRPDSDRSATSAQHGDRYSFTTESRLHTDAQKKSVPEQPRKKASKKSKKRSVFWARFRVALITCLCAGAVVALGVGAGMYAAVSQEIEDMDFDGIAYNFSSVVYANDANGNSHEVEHLHSDGNREWVDSDKIPDIAKEAAVSIEDERFYKHGGVDLKRTAGATLGWVVSKVTGKSPSYGGSTITQQVIKNITQEKDKTVTRKIKEMMRAVALEKRFTKDEILTMYLNIAYFGNQCYGIESSSKVYFSKNAVDLTLPQAAMIVGITQAPSRYDPFRNPEDALAKRNTVLKKMHDLHKISDEEYEQASASELGVNSRYNSPDSNVYSYFVDQVINDIISDLQTQKGYSKTFASQQVFSGGLKIYTTMDSNIQDAMESVYENTANFPAASKGTQSAMVIIDPSNGEIKGIVGGIGKKTESRGLNRATHSRRQPGSSVKPLSVYSPALETGKINAATILTDKEITIGDWSPKNSYSGYKGNMSVRKAIEISCNTTAVQTLQSLGIDTSYNFMTNKYHFTSLTDSDKNLSALGLGGMTNGVSPKEMAAAYAAFANKGVYITPHTYTKVLDSAGKVLLEYKPESTRVLSEANAFIMSDFLKEVVYGSAGTGRNARLSKMPTYGKTGTTNDNCDKWFVGFTPYYVGATWFGFDSMTPLTKAGVSNNVSTAVWKKVMEKVHADLPSKKIEQPDNVTAVSICQKTGKLSSSGCSYAKTEYFVNGTVPTKYCNNSGHYSGHTTSSEGSSSSTNSEHGSDATSSPSHSPAPSDEPAATKTPVTPKPAEPTPAPPSGDDVITID